MTSYLRLCGAVAVLVAVFFIAREYSVFARRRLDELRGFHSLLEYIGGGISKYLSFGSGLWNGFSCDKLESCGFLQMLRDGEHPGKAFSRCKSRLALSTEQKDVLEKFFLDFGREYKDSELKRVSEYRVRLGETLEKEVLELEKNVKVVRALLLGGGLSVVILVI